ncbi:acyltransferase family protein [Arthrobacter sp. NPDC055138]
MKTVTPPRKFLPEIQALRALAVLLVVVYHLEPRWLPGGFVGVDVFFVISGFLITGHMLREAAATGTLSLRSFWAARARRILPAALLVIAVVLAATLALLPMSQWERVGSSALASTFYVQNWVLAASSVDYLAATETPTPLQHFWSLAVEEQFYLLWPLLVLLAVLVLRVRRRSSRPGGWGSGTRSGEWTVERTAAAIFAVVVAASLAYGIWATAGGSPDAYFITPTRIWELGLGGLLAALHHDPLRWPHLRSLLAAAGLAAIVASAFLFDGGTPFPGTAALLPVLGTVAVIAAGRTSGPLSLHRLVDWRPIQWTGNVSYSLYLWHWPLIVFFTMLAGREPGPATSPLLLAGSFGLAALSYYLVETPVRRFGWFSASAWRPLAASAAATALVGTLAFVPGNQQERILEQRDEAIAALLDAPPPGFGVASLKDSGYQAFATQNPLIVPDPTRAGDDQSGLGDCAVKPMAAETKECTYGDPDADFTLALVGDSHAGQWFKALEPIAQRQGWRLLTYIHNSCPFNAEQRQIEANSESVCGAPNEQTLKRLTADGGVNAVLTSYYAESAFVDSGTGHRPGVAGFADYWNKLADAGVDVYALKDTPRPREGALARDCAAANYEDPSGCGQPRNEGLDGEDRTDEAAALAPRTEVVDLSSRFCDRDTCPAVIGNVLVYRDLNHVSGTYMKTLSAPLESALLQAMRK